MQPRRGPDGLDHAIVEKLQTTLLALDDGFRVVRANGHFQRTFQPAGETHGQPVLDVTGALGASWEFQQALRSPPQAFRFVLEGPVRRVLLVRVEALDAPATGLLVSMEDVTAQDALAAMLRDRALALERSNDDLQQFAYVASHDLQEPLRMVASYTQVLAETCKGRLDPEAEECMRFVVDGAQRMQRLVNDLLEYARVSTKAQSLRPTPAGPLLESAWASLAGPPQRDGATLTCGPMPTVLADASQVCQVFQNLLSNALKFRGPDPPAVHVCARLDGDQWEFSVQDNGIGIDPKYHRKLFVLFQRLHSRDEYPGTGIGLALCKKIVERHGGRIWVESGAGGATFRFTLPAAGGAA